MDITRWVVTVLVIVVAGLVAGVWHLAAIEVKSLDCPPATCGFALQPKMEKIEPRGVYYGTVTHDCLVDGSGSLSAYGGPSKPCVKDAHSSVIEP